MFKDQNIIFKKLEKFTKDKLLETMYKYKWSPQKSYDYFMNLTPYGIDDWDSIKKLKINWFGVTRLKTISWSKIIWEIKTLLVFQEWIQEIFKDQDIIFQ
jgi:hypothetical protein